MFDSILQYIHGHRVLNNNYFPSFGCVILFWFLIIKCITILVNSDIKYGMRKSFFLNRFGRIIARYFFETTPVFTNYFKNNLIPRNFVPLLDLRF